MIENNLKKWNLDKSHSSVEFSIRHMMISSVKGSFKDFDAQIEMDPSNIEATHAKFIVKVASIDTNQPDRDNHLKSPDFFDVSKFSDIVYETKSISKKGDDIEVTGNLTIKGVSKSVTFNGEFHGPIKDPYGKQRIGFDGEATVNRKDFGLNWNMILEGGGLMVGDNVKLSVHLEAFSD